MDSGRVLRLFLTGFVYGLTEAVRGKDESRMTPSLWPEQLEKPRLTCPEMWKTGGGRSFAVGNRVQQSSR